MNIIPATRFRRRGALGLLRLSLVDLLPDRLLVVPLLPVGAWQREGLARPCPGQLGHGGPHSGADDHAGRELHGRAQRGRRHPPVRRRIAGSDRERDAGREFGAEPQCEGVGRSVVADGEHRLGFVRRLRLLKRDKAGVRGPQLARLGAPVTGREVPEGAGIDDPQARHGRKLCPITWHATLKPV
jgi:hypothetical protein